VRVIGAAIGVIVLVVMVTLFVVLGITSAPFNTKGESTIGKMQNSFGDRYTLDAATYSGTWTFSRDADVVLRFDDGTLTFDDQPLEAGCYSDAVTRDDVITINDAHGVHFASPDSDATCRPLPQ
jgi:hypothetical protein